MTHLSVVVVPVGGPAFVRRCLMALLGQKNDAIDEIVVPYPAQEPEYERLASEFPAVAFTPVSVGVTRPHRFAYAAHHEVYDVLKARGLAACHGAVVALIEDTVIPDHDWGAQVLAAHALPHGVIGGAVEHAGRGLLNWAVYVMDFGRYALPLAEGPQPSLTDLNVSYKAEVLTANGDLWRQRYHETELHTGLLKRGTLLWLKPQIVVRQDRGPLAFRELLSERFQWGWVYGAKRAAMVSRLTRIALIVFSPAIPFIRMLRLAGKVFTDRKNVRRLLVALPHLVSLTIAWSFGELYGYLKPARNNLDPETIKKTCGTTSESTS